MEARCEFINVQSDTNFHLITIFVNFSCELGPIMTICHFIEGRGVIF